MTLIQCKKCEKVFYEDNGKLIDHVMIRHPKAFMEWTIDNNKVFKVAKQEDRDQLVSSFFVITEIGDK